MLLITSDEREGLMGLPKSCVSGHSDDIRAQLIGNSLHPTVLAGILQDLPWAQALSGPDPLPGGRWNCSGWPGSGSSSRNAA